MHRLAVVRLSIVTGIALGILGTSVEARASNVDRVRTAVDWTGAACVTLVDRSERATVNIPYGVPYEDTDVTVDELEDSRTFQFFALCRQHHTQASLPMWISWSDVMRATAIDLAPDDLTDDDVLETASAWEGCFVALNANDDRFPITRARAARGVDWDTTGMAAGPYMIAGYTWEPIKNLWTERPGMVVVHDGGGPASVAPGISITTQIGQAFATQTVLIEGCVTGDESTRLTGYWASLKGVEQSDWAPQWVTFAQNVVPDGQTVALPFEIPMSAVGGNIMVRVDAEDSQGRRTEGYLKTYIVGLIGEAPSHCSDGSFVVVPGCVQTSDGTGTSGDASTGATDGSIETAGDVSSGEVPTPSDSTGPHQDSDGKSGGCSFGNVSGSRWTLWILAGWVATRRKRYSSTKSKSLP